MRPGMPRWPGKCGRAGTFSFPTSTGQAYSHKPPLLFWLIHAGWWLFGVSEEWLRLVAPGFGLASLVAVRWLARKLWPGDGLAAELAPLVLLGSALFAATATLTLFDLLLVFFVVIALWRRWRRGAFRSLVRLDGLRARHRTWRPVQRPGHAGVHTAGWPAGTVVVGNPPARRVGALVSRPAGWRRLGRRDRPWLGAARCRGRGGDLCGGHFVEPIERAYRRVVRS